MKPSAIRVISIGLFRREDAILVFEAHDRVKASPYYRPLGGGVHPGEGTREALAREIREEIGCEVADLELRGVLENIFECNGKPGHEIVFVYEGRFVDPAIYARDRFALTEDDGQSLPVAWRRLSDFDDHHRLVPEGLMRLIALRP